MNIKGEKVVQCTEINKKMAQLVWCVMITKEILKHNMVKWIRKQYNIVKEERECSKTLQNIHYKKSSKTWNYTEKSLIYQATNKQAKWQKEK